MGEIFNKNGKTDILLRYEGKILLDSIKLHNYIIRVLKQENGNRHSRLTI